MRSKVLEGPRGDLSSRAREGGGSPSFIFGNAKAIPAAPKLYPRCQEVGKNAEITVQKHFSQFPRLDDRLA